MMLNVTTKEKTPSLLPSSEQPCRCFSMAELNSATDNFDEKWCIGHGGFGKVYKGNFSDGPTNIYAIKRLHFESHQGATEFWVEVKMLSRLRHCNIVPLIGFCKEGKEMAIVYEFMHNGTLYDHLHKKGTVLTWSQRLKICLGAAYGLDYLHTHQGVIHRDVKSTNILLDQNYGARIADFGLAKVGKTNQTHSYVTTTVKGTFGHMDPSYFYTGRLTRKSDVYAFGVVLLEVLCGRPALDESLDDGLAIWAQDRIKQGKVNQIIDSKLRDHISKSSLKEFSHIAVRCLLDRRNQRPTMTQVVGSLHQALLFQERKASSSQGKVTVNNVWSLLSLKGLFELRSTRAAEGTIIKPSTLINENVCLSVEQDEKQSKSNVVNTSYSIHPINTPSFASTSSLIEPVTRLTRIKEPIRISNGDDGYTESNSVTGSGGLGVELGNKCMSDHVPSKEGKNSGAPTETVTRLTGIKEPIRISKGDDGYSESNSLNGSGCSGVELGTKCMSDHVPSEERENSGLNTRDLAYDSSIIASSHAEADCTIIYEPGVYISILALPDGTDELKRVRFSRRRFSENEAETWWSENRANVYQRYNVSLPVPSVLSEVKADERERLEGQDENCSKSNQVNMAPTETVTRLT